MAATEIRGYGHSVKRKEDPRFLRGKGTYVDDITLPGMLYMDIVRSPFAHAKITNISTQAALETPGVLAVVDHTSRHEDADSVPGLQGEGRLQVAERRRSWPATRVAAIAGIAAIAALGITRGVAVARGDGRHAW